MAKKLRVPKATVEAVTSTPSTPEAKGKAKTTVPKEKAAPVASKYVTLVAGERMRVAQFQDHLFSINDRKDRRLTDEELVAEWKAAFPAVTTPYEPYHVIGARRDYNLGMHSKEFTGKKDVGTPGYASQWVRNADGTRVKAAAVKAETAKAKKKVKVTAAAAATDQPVTETVAVPKKRVARKQTAA
jgi:hypothetical protein